MNVVRVFFRYYCSMWEKHIAPIHQKLVQYARSGLQEEIQRSHDTLESIHVNFNIGLRSVITEIPCKVFSHMPLDPVPFEDELAHFKSHFSF